MSKARTDVLSFEDTMAELEAFGKALAAKPLAKAKPTKGQDNIKDTAGNEEDGAEREEEDDYAGEAMGKSTGKAAAKAKEADPDAHQEEMDAEAFLKKANAALSQTVTKSVQALQTKQDEVSAMLIKALVTQGHALQSITEELSALREETEAMGKEPAMRKSKVSVHDRQPSGGAPEGGETDNGNKVVKVLLAKCMPQAQGNLLQLGVLGPQLVAELEHFDNRGLGLPPHLKHLEQYATA